MSGKKKLVTLAVRPLKDRDGQGATSHPSPKDESSRDTSRSKKAVKGKDRKQPELSFITTTQAEAKDEKTRRLVRSHVMKRHHAHLRQTKTYKRKEVELIPKPTSVLGCGRVDPFSSYPRPVFANEHKLIDFYITHFSHIIDSVLSPEFAGASSKIWFPTAIKEPILFEGMLLIGCRGLKAISRDSLLDSKALMYRGRIIRLLNDALSDPERATSDGTIAALMCLAFDEYNHGNSEAYDQHAQAMLQLVEMRGGLKKLGMKGFLAETIRSSDLAVAYYRASTPYFEHKVKPHDVILIDSLTQGFLAQEILSNLSEDMIGILNDMCTISAALETSPIGVLPATGPASYQTLMACQNSLLILCVGRKTPMLLLEHPDIQECVCLATEVYRSRILCGYPPLVGAMGGDSYVSKDIHDTMMRILVSEFRHECLELMLWIAFVGTLTAVAQSGTDRWVEMIDRLAPELHLYSWQDVKVCLRRFLWYGRRCEELWGKVWDEVETGRRSRACSEDTN